MKITAIEKVKKSFINNPIELLILLLFLFYPCYLFAVKVSIIPIKMLLLIITISGVSFAEIYLLLKNRTEKRKYIIRLDVALVSFLILAIINIFVDVSVEKIYFHILIAISIL